MPDPLQCCVVASPVFFSLCGVKSCHYESKHRNFFVQNEPKKYHITHDYQSLHVFLRKKNQQNNRLCGVDPFSVLFMTSLGIMRHTMRRRSFRYIVSIKVITFHIINFIFNFFIDFSCSMPYITFPSSRVFEFFRVEKNASYGGNAASCSFSSESMYSYGKNDFCWTPSP